MGMPPLSACTTSLGLSWRETHKSHLRPVSHIQWLVRQNFFMMDACHILKLTCYFCRFIYICCKKLYLNMVVCSFTQLSLDVKMNILLFVLVWAVTYSFSAGVQSNHNDQQTDSFEVHHSPQWCEEKDGRLAASKITVYFENNEMRVSLAAQTLSRSMSVALRTIRDLGYFSWKTVRQRQNSLR